MKIRRGSVAIALLVCVTGGVASAHTDDLPTLRSKQSGAWSDAATWDAGRTPHAGDRVYIRAGDKVTYDANSEDVIRLIQIAGTLEFARDRDTRLDVGLIKIIAGDDLCEEGFDCHMTVDAPQADAPRPTLLVGTAEQPIPADRHALIRLHYVPGMNAESCPAIVCCAGRMEFHGSPIAHPWMKLSQPGRPGKDLLWVAESVDGWREGDRILITRTRRRQEVVNGPPIDEPEQNEIRTITALGQVSPESKGRVATPEAKLALPFGSRDASTYGFSVHLDKPLEFEHDAADAYRGEVANLSRNVVVESADPAGVRGHTMYHKYSTGSISYAEFRHLGKKGLLGRYPIHFHLVGDTMRGSYVKGASVWDSDNRWIVLHGANFLRIVDCVGYNGLGHGFFLENGAETFNALDHNLAVLAKEAKPLPEQTLPYDQNLGAGFWWANCHNAFCNNVAVDCDEYGYRFDSKRDPKFDPAVSLLQPDGSQKPQDIRSLPFVKFENNEVHSQRSGGLNLRGISRPKGMIYEKINKELVREARESSPDQRYPFWVHNFRAWDCSWAFNSGTGGVFLDGFDAFADDYVFWRPVLDRSVWRHVTMHGILNKDLHMPFTVGLPEADDKTQLDYLTAIQGFVDDFPPFTSITQVVRSGDHVVVRGATYDSTSLRCVTVNDANAISTRDNFAEWEATLPAAPDRPLSVSAFAEDAYGNVEPRPHRVEVEK